MFKMKTNPIKTMVYTTSKALEYNKEKREFENMNEIFSFAKRLEDEGDILEYRITSLFKRVEGSDILTFDSRTHGGIYACDLWSE